MDSAYISPYSFLWLFIGIFSVSCGTELPEQVASVADELPEQIDFNFHIKPILSDRCFACHGPDANKREAGLRLDQEESAYGALTSGNGYALVPGSIEKSQVYHRILSEDPELQMPPPESNLVLSVKEKALLIRWIKEGAAYRDHWAFIPPELPELPEVKQSGWVKNEIDRFVLARLERENIEPSDRARKEQLIRRLSFDLTGLPPTLEEIDAFLEDEDPSAYEKVVDRLLAAPAYGERMAAHWMDVARYADSEGYLDDFWRRMWPWRDWVIQAFNKNLSYDQFVLWQIGGDQIPDAGHEQVLATGFNRNHKHNSEGGIIPEEFRIENVADRTNTLGRAFMGLTLGCARCHDHKYDPISQQDYFQLFSFFNSTNERGDGILGNGAIDPGPTLPLTQKETREIIDFIENRIDEQEQFLHQSRVDSEAAFGNWDEAHRSTTEALSATVDRKRRAAYDFDAIEDRKFTNAVRPQQQGSFWEISVVPGHEGEALKMESGGSVTFPGEGITFERTEPFSFSFYINSPKAFEEANVIFNANSRVQGYRGYDVVIDSNHLSFRISHAWPYQSLHVESVETLPLNEWIQLTFTYDGSSRAEGIKMYWNGTEVATRIVHNRLYRSAVPRNGTYIYIPYQGMGAGNRHYDADFAGGKIDEVQVFNGELSPLEVAYLYDPEEAMTIWSTDRAARKLFYQHNQDPGIAAARDSLQYWHRRHLATIDTVTEIMVMGDLEEPRPTYILERGEYDKQGKAVSPNVPASILSWNEELPRNRYGLGRWLIDRNNPLTARVMVNRLWQLVFGEGIVQTSEDFGNQGALPTHPQLLDWLAVTFMDSGWDMKHMLKLMVMSATYQQASVVRPELQDVDPDNHWLARSPRYRWTAEMVRDNALAVSGLLVDKLGGPGVFPYQPEGLWREVSNHPWGPFYHADDAEGLYRRSLYTIWKRNVPPPYMLIFDANDRNQCEVRRQNSSTPLQALVLLNDPQMVEASRVLAQRSLLEADSDPDMALKKAFRRLTSRHPSSREMTILNRQLKEELAYFKDRPEALQDFVAVGEAMPSEQLDPVSLAALSVVCNTVMNTTEAYYKN